MNPFGKLRDGMGIFSPDSRWQSKIGAGHACATGKADGRRAQDLTWRESRRILEAKDLSGENMRYDKLTLKAQEALQEADSLAHAYNHPVMDVEHLLLALLEQKDGVILPLLDRIGADPGEIAEAVKESLGRKPKVHGDA